MKKPVRCAIEPGEAQAKKSDFSLLPQIHFPIHINVLKITPARYFQATGTEKGELFAP